MLPEWAVVGRWVVCINASRLTTNHNYYVDLVEGKKYRLCWVGETSVTRNGRLTSEVMASCKVDTGPGTPVHEVHDSQGANQPFRLARFRPLVEKSMEADVAEFQSLLHTKTVSEDV